MEGGILDSQPTSRTATRFQQKTGTELFVFVNSLSVKKQRVVVPMSAILLVSVQYWV